jgi:UDP-glucose 4-epimerase
MQKNILLTGGNGFIGSHTIIEILKNNNYNVIIIDNLVNSNINNIDLVKKIVYPKDYIFMKEIF